MSIVIVDKYDKPIGLKTYEELEYQDIYQVSALWLTDIRSSDILLAQRKWTKTNDPGKWAAAVAGTVDQDEDYQINIVKEIEEEIGLKNLELKVGPKQFTDDGSHKYFVQWFLAKVDKESTRITIQEEEVEAVDWVPENKLIQDARTNPGKYAPNFIDSLKLLGYKAS
ncbi:MAG TPA: NUDIX domain-containing protein [Candidatus Saccharimonadales bacterium]|nr:NUDIX domain-containing protein [Candidatus Saccharimonadales bacterium]